MITTPNSAAFFRYGTSNREAGALVSAFLRDLIRAGILPADAASLAVDGSKIQRAKDAMMEEARARRTEKLKEQPPSGIMFDSRIDKFCV